MTGYMIGLGTSEPSAKEASAAIDRLFESYASTTNLQTIIEAYEGDSGPSMQASQLLVRATAAAMLVFIMETTGLTISEGHDE